MRAYRAADTTGDGWISAEDFHSLLRYLAFFHHRWPLFNQLDEEHDGKIPIAAAVQFGARAWGIEYNKDLAALA